jgi:hypothetical protein
MLFFAHWYDITLLSIAHTLVTVIRCYIIMRVLSRGVIMLVLVHCAAVVAASTSSLPSVSDSVSDIFSDTTIAELPSSAHPFASPMRTALTHCVQFCSNFSCLFIVSKSCSPFLVLLLFDSPSRFQIGLHPLRCGILSAYTSSGGPFPTPI